MVKEDGTVVMCEEQRYGVKPHPQGKGCYESYGYDYISELDHDEFDVVVDLEGHMRAVRFPR